MSDQLLTWRRESLISGTILPSFDKSHVVSAIVITGDAVATPLLPVSPNAAAAARAVVSKLWGTSAVRYREETSVTRSQLQLTCLYTRRALQQADLTFNSNYTFGVTKPQSLGYFSAILAKAKRDVRYVQCCSLPETPRVT